MVGIVSFGAYVPLRRLGPGTRGWSGQSEKAVAFWDEDSLTMAVAAARDCIGNGNRSQIDGVYFASTTSPYREKLVATTLAMAADLRNDIATADITDTLRCGTTAFRLAADSVKAGSAKKVLLAVSDRRLGTSGLDADFADGAAAFIIGDTDVAASLIDSYTVSNELLDVWRAEGSRRTRTWEDRYVFEEGYQKVVPAAVAAFLKKAGIAMTDIAKVVLYAPDARRHREMAARLKLQPAQVQESLFDKMGNTGAAFSLMQLVAALENAKPGDKILCVSYGDGADILLLQATDKIAQVKPRLGMKKSLAAKMMLPGMDYAGRLPERRRGRPGAGRQRLRFRNRPGTGLHLPHARRQVQDLRYNPVPAAACLHQLPHQGQLRAGTHGGQESQDLPLRPQAGCATSTPAPASIPWSTSTAAAAPSSA